MQQTELKGLHIQSTKKIHGVLALGIATGCSIALTIITILPPATAGDWARLDQFGKYIPNLTVYDWPSYKLQFSLWITLIVSLWWAFGRLTKPYIPNIPNDRKASPKVVSYAMPLLVLLILLGFGLRLYTLGRLPLLIDEIGFAARAADMLHGQRIPIFAAGHNGNPATFSWLLSGSMAFFGQSIFAVRLVSLAFGTLSIPAAYALGRAWWSRRAGLIAAAFLATYPAHVYFSRLALYNIVDPLFALLALAALKRALRYGRLTDFGLAGMLVGVAQYFYHGSRLLPVLMVVYVVITIYKATRQGRKGFFIQNQMRFYAAMLFAFGVVSLPRFAPMLTGRLPLTGNLDNVRLPDDLGDNALRSILAWVGQADVSPFWLSDAPLLPFAALLACAMGVIICLRRLRDPRHVILVSTLVLTTVFGGIIWTAAPLYVRYMTALPALVLLAALPFEYMLKRTGLNHTDINRKDAKDAEIQARYRWKIWLVRGFIIIIITQGIIMSVQHTQEAYEHVPAGLWEEDTLARAAAQLPADVEARLSVSDDFGTVERITIADYVAFYGQRRAITIITK